MDDHPLNALMRNAANFDLSAANRSQMPAFPTGYATLLPGQIDPVALQQWQIPQPSQQISSLDQWKTEIQKQDILCKKFAGELRAALFGTAEQRDTTQANEHSKNQEQDNYQMSQNGKERSPSQDSHQMDAAAETVYELPPVSFPSSPFPIPNPEAFLSTYFNVQFVNNTP